MTTCLNLRFYKDWKQWTIVCRLNKNLPMDQIRYVLTIINVLLYNSVNDVQEKTKFDTHLQVEDTALFTQPNFEDRLVSFCQNMTARIWRHGEELSVSWFSSLRGMTLLHLAASLGYSKLVCAMLHWRAENSSLLLETEVDALSQDEDGYTPLVHINKLHIIIHYYTYLITDLI